MALVGVLLVAYLLGSIPTAAVAARIATRGAVDIRSAGTGNPGAANALTVLGAKWGLVILVIDIAKAAAACLLAWWWVGPDAANLAGTAAVVGHCYPVWTAGRGGGKGVACSVGQCIVTFPVYFPVDLVVALLSAIARFRRNAYAVTIVSCVFWVGGAAAWSAFDLPNAWGPEPTPALPLAAALSSAVIVQRFVAGAKTAAAAQLAASESSRA